MLNIRSLDDAWRTPISIENLQQGRALSSNIIIPHGDDDVSERDVKENFYGQVFHATDVDLTRFESKRLIVSADEKPKLFGIVREQDKVLLNADIIKVVEESLEKVFKGKELDCEIVSLRQGAAMRAIITLPESESLLFKRGNVTEESRLTVVIGNSYDGTVGTKISLGTYRLICSNGAVAGVNLTSIPKGSVIKAIKGGSVTDSLIRVIANAQSLKERWRQWDETQVEFESVVDFLGKAFPRKLIETVLHPGMYPMSVFALYQHLTDIASHFARTSSEQFRLDARISNLFYNEKSKLHRLINAETSAESMVIGGELIESD